MPKQSRKTPRTKELTQNSPTPWPIQVADDLAQLNRRVAQLEADRDELKATVLSAAAKTLKARR
jgi:hypothetical protein